MSHAVKPSKRASPRYVLTPGGRVIPRDTSEHEGWLIVHGETKGGAYVVSRRIEEQPVCCPKALLDLGAFGGGFERQDANNQRRLLPIRLASGPGFIFDEKGLR